MTGWAELEAATRLHVAVQLILDAERDGAVVPLTEGERRELAAARVAIGKVARRLAGVAYGRVGRWIGG